MQITYILFLMIITIIMIMMMINISSILIMNMHTYRSCSLLTTLLCPAPSTPLWELLMRGPHAIFITCTSSLNHYFDYCEPPLVLTYALYLHSWLYFVFVFVLPVYLLPCKFIQSLTVGKVLGRLSGMNTRQSKKCGFCIYIYDNFFD